jgi:hypothetical protein
MSSHEKLGDERIAVQKQAIQSLKRLIDDEPRSQSYLKAMVRKWNGVVALEQGDWIKARFEFLQGRTVSEQDDPGSTTWFDAAMVETEVWEAFTSPRLSLGALRELPEKLDLTSTLYSAAADRSNAKFASDWGQWIEIFIEPSVPTPHLAERILSYVEGRPPVGDAGGEFPVKQLAHATRAFEWKRFWLMKTAYEVQASLKTKFKMDAPLDALARGAAVLAVPPADFASLMQSGIAAQDKTPPDSAEQLLERIQSELEQWQALEKGSREYVAEVGKLLDSSPQRRKDAIQAIRLTKPR